MKNAFPSRGFWVISVFHTAKKNNNNDNNNDKKLKANQNARLGQSWAAPQGGFHVAEPPEPAHVSTRSHLCLEPH